MEDSANHLYEIVEHPEEHTHDSTSNQKSPEVKDERQKVNRVDALLFGDVVTDSKNSPVVGINGMIDCDSPLVEVLGSVLAAVFNELFEVLNVLVFCHKSRSEQTYDSEVVRTPDTQPWHRLNVKRDETYSEHQSTGTDDSEEHNNAEAGTVDGIDSNGRHVDNGRTWMIERMYVFGKGSLIECREL